MRSRLLVLLPLLSLAACGGARTGSDGPPALLDVWTGLHGAAAQLAQQGIPCDAAWDTWFEEFGVRGVACVAATVVAPTEVVARAGVRPYVSGPHVVTADAFALSLTSERAFGHYDPDFVAWVVEHGVVGEGRPEVRALTQPVYDRYLRRLARLYWLAYADMAADGFPDRAPAGLLAGYAAFLDGGPIPEGAEGYEGGFSVFAFSGLSEGLLPRLGFAPENEWEAKYEANTAFGFWLRRRADGTAARWHDGLRRLLATYDAGWLAANA
jgi:hypothetical protein